MYGYIVKFVCMVVKHFSLFSSDSVKEEHNSEKEDDDSENKAEPEAAGGAKEKKRKEDVSLNLPFSNTIVLAVKLCVEIVWVLVHSVGCECERNLCQRAFLSIDAHPSGVS